MLAFLMFAVVGTRVHKSWRRSKGFSWLHPTRSTPDGSANTFDSPNVHALQFRVLQRCQQTVLTKWFAISQASYYVGQGMTVRPSLGMKKLIKDDPTLWEQFCAACRRRREQKKLGIANERRVFQKTVRDLDLKYQ